MSSLYMRMQPYETNPPTDFGAFVPWIAYSPPASVIAATPSGFVGEPPGMSLGNVGLSRRTASGGAQLGRRYFPSTYDTPVHCRSARPTPTTYRTARLSSSTR